ncbi:hypothetical protein [Vallitalea guaymasensis]|uniref:hypothetical protein n=1 Tax=Vallitalea guaymasensis TaxID=1185412 RepID=UPI00235736C0|nr:hypothetical protein [Vallitalea guaymasensis]
MYTFRKVNGERDNLTNLEQHFEYIQKYYSFDFCNIEGGYKMQLFHQDEHSIDDVPCLADFNGETILSVVSQAMDWIDEYSIGK